MSSATNLRQHAVRGMKWAVLGRLMKSLVGLATVAVLSHYLTPAEFGSVMLVTIIASFAQLFVDAGLRVALVQRKENTRLQQDTVFWSSLALSVAIALGVLVMAGPIARALGSPAIEPLIRWITLVFPLSALQSVSMTILERKFAFKRISMSDFLAALFGALTAVGLALAGWTMGALIAQQLVLAATTTVIICGSARFVPRLRFSWAEFRSLMGYGGYVMLTNVVGFMNANMDRAIIGAAISPSALGYFSMARTVVESPSKVIVKMARKVLFPILSSVQDDRARLGNAYLRIQFTMAAVMMPACMGIAAIADPLVALIFAPEWAPVAPLIAYVSLRMLIKPIQQINQVTLASMGLARFQFYWSIMAGSISLIAIWHAAQWGLETAILARLGVLLLFTPVLSIYTLRQMGLPPMRLSHVLLAPIIATTAMYLVISWALPRLPFADPWLILAGIVMGAAVYLPVIFLMAPERAKDLTQTFLKRAG